MLAGKLLQTPEYAAGDLEVDTFGLLTSKAVERVSGNAAPRRCQPLIKGVNTDVCVAKQIA